MFWLRNKKKNCYTLLTEDLKQQSIRSKVDLSSAYKESAIKLCRLDINLADAQPSSGNCMCDLF